jgi:ketosteroid isomerase-like protein
MTRTTGWLAAGLFLFVAVSGCTNSSAPTTAPQLGDVAKIEALLKDQAEAWNRGDLDGFMAGYWDSPDLEFVSGTTTTKGFGPTKERYFKRYKAEGKEMGTLTFSDIAVTLNGEREATATGKWKVVMSKESPSGGFTLTLRKFEYGWKIVKDVTTSDEPPKK